MINYDQSALLLYCCEDVKLHHSGCDTVSLKLVVSLSDRCDFMSSQQSNNTLQQFCEENKT